MRKTLRALVAIVSILVAVLAIVSFFYRLGDMRTSGERSSGAEYSILRNTLMSLQTERDLADPALRARLLALYKASDRLLAAQVLDPSGMTAWKIPSVSRYFALPNDSSVRSGFSAPEGSTVIFTTPLSDGMRLSALYATLRRADISTAAKLPLMVVTLWCLIVALSFLFLGGKAKTGVPPKPADKSLVQPETALPPEDESSPVIEAEATVNHEPGPAFEPVQEPLDIPEDEDLREAGDLPEEPEESGIVEDKPPAPLSGKSFEESLAKLEEDIIDWSSRYPDQNEEMDEELGEELDELETSPEDEPEENEASATADSRETLQEFEELNAEATAEKKDLAELPMPLSLGDSLLEARLSEELARGPRTEVSLMLIHCGISSRTDPAAVALAVTVKDYIGTKDLIFELYKGGFAVVLPSVDLGGALKMSEDLADVLSTTLGLYRDIEGEAPVFIGISARSERKVDAYKIYREASTAVHKAFSGSQSRILAFRPKTE